MSDPALPLQGAVVAALKAHAGLTALVSGRIHDRVPMTPVFPYVALGEDQILDDSTTCEEAFECFLTLHAWSRLVGRPEVKRIADAVRDALNVALQVTGFTVVDFAHRETRYLYDEDGVTAHAVVTFRYLIDPA